MADEDTLSATAVARTEVPLVSGISSNYTAGGMTYLQLLQRLRQECGVSGNNPSTAQNLPGEMARLANYIKQAWMDIQTMHDDWEFLRQPVSFVTTADQQKYNSNEMLITSFGRLKLDSFTIHSVDDVSDEMILPYMDYEHFKVMYMFGSRRTQTSRPVVFSTNSQGDFLLGSVPNGQYQIQGECWALPTELSLDNDRPAAPGQFHMAIVYRAMMMYGQYEAAPEVYQHGATEFNKIAARLAAHQLPRLTFGAPLA